MDNCNAEKECLRLRNNNKEWNNNPLNSIHPGDECTSLDTKAWLSYLASRVLVPYLQHDVNIITS